MNSCLYKCSVMHRRASPKRHAFKYNLFMFYIDLDELDLLDEKIGFFGRNRFAPYEFRDSDHYNPRRIGLKKSIESYIREQGIEEPIGNVRLLTHLRVWGHLFNPVSFYFVDNRAGEPLCSIAEVGNTFHEQKLYLIQTNADRNSNARCAKEFYVSPFSELDTQFHFKIAEPNQRLRLAIDQSRNSEVYFRSALVGSKQPISSRALAMSALRFPFITIQIVAAIHWQAFLLFLKGVPFHRKSENPHLQTNTHPYLVKESYPERY